MLRIPPKEVIIFGMEKEKLELYTDYLICNSGYSVSGAMGSRRLPIWLVEGI